MLSKVNKANAQKFKRQLIKKQNVKELHFTVGGKLAFPN